MNAVVPIKPSEQVEVQVYNFSQLLTLGYPLALDNYQRPYVWSREKIEQLVQDLHEFEQQSLKSTTPDYYMGALLLHRNHNKKQLYVIDGQQRLTSLCVLHHTLEHNLPESVEFSFRSKLSAHNIQQAKVVYNQLQDTLPSADIFQKLCFTVITVESEDLAFTFFDTQNNRGVPLAATDLLKAFHLRAIHSEDAKQDEALQQHCARRWETLQVKGQSGSTRQENDFAPELFHYYLWRARNWKGQNLIERETRDDVLSTFQKQSIPSDKQSVAHTPLYPGVNNQLAANLSLLPSNEFRLDLQSLDMSSNPATLPFSLRQPIHQGVGFFLYAQKYAALLNQLLYSENPEPEVKAFRRFYNSVMKQTSHYLRELFNLAVLAHVDQFGTQGLLRFALWLDHALGALRLTKAIYEPAIRKFLKERDQNLLDVIVGAYRPEEVVAFLQSDQDAKASYRIRIDCA
ncbi:DUF262 domain-containing protein [Endozoicomonas ascidiicola]|uniref:DUF262 domain-containing protein n=1 Tax=Endozoicomonas ascidiicola TaxID=1698521 RepID=UPI0008308FF0|nr:DUF262 domain-containing protein [Endozoicomonas ascidiicola]